MSRAPYWKVHWKRSFLTFRRHFPRVEYSQRSTTTLAACWDPARSPPTTRTKRTKASRPRPATKPTTSSMWAHRMWPAQPQRNQKMIDCIVRSNNTASSINRRGEIYGEREREREKRADDKKSKLRRCGVVARRRAVEGGWWDHWTKTEKSNEDKTESKHKPSDHIRWFIQS